MTTQSSATQAVIHRCFYHLQHVQTVTAAAAVLLLLRRLDPDWMDGWTGRQVVGSFFGFRQRQGLVPVSDYIALRAGEDRLLRQARRFNGKDPRFVNGTAF